MSVTVFTCERECRLIAFKNLFEFQFCIFVILDFMLLCLVVLCSELYGEVVKYFFGMF